MTTDVCLIEKLISEVGKRPVLYNPKQDKSGRAVAWIEIFHELHPDWKKFDEYETKVKISELQLKWKNLRCCYARNKKLLKTPCKFGFKRRKYLYHENLHFLDNVENSVFENNSNDVSLDNQNNVDECSSLDDEVAAIEVKVLDIEEPNPTEECSKVDKECPDVTGEKSDTKEEEFDEDKYFMLSTLPYLRKLSPDQKIAAKIEILKTIREKLGHNS